MAPSKRARGRTIVDLMQAQSRTRSQTQAQMQINPHTQSQSQSQPQPQPNTQSQRQRQPHTQSQYQTHDTTQHQQQSSETTQHTGTIEIGSTSTRRGRGKAKGLETWGTGKKLHIDFNEHMQPIGDNRKHLSTHLGILARNGQQVPLHYEKWTDMPDDVLEYIWKEVQDNTDAPLEYKGKCLSNVGDLWRKWKHQVKKDHYDTYNTDEERLSFTPDRVEASQWKTLVAYWGTEERKEISNINKRNRELHEAPHRTGKKPFAQIRVERESQGLPTDRVSMFIETRTSKNGRALNPSTNDLISELNARVESVPAADRTPTFREQVFKEVFGNDSHGRVRTFGAGPTPRSVFGKGAGSSTLKDLIDNRVREEVQSAVQSMMADIERRVREELLADLAKGRDNHQSRVEEVPTASSVHRPNAETLRDSPSPCENQVMEDEEL